MIEEYTLAILMQLTCTIGYLLVVAIMERLGRKTIYILNGSVMAICMAVLAATLQYQQQAWR